MSLFGDASIDAASDTCYRPWSTTRLALDAAIAALDETELIEKAAKAIHGGKGCTCRAGAKGDARAVLVAIGLLPEETRP